VEDYVVSILPPSDFGDYSGFGIAGSSTSTTIKMGSQVDGEASNLANATATGDDASGVDDEDGVTLPATVIQGQSGVSVTVNVTNTTQFGTDYSAGAIDQNGFEAGTLSNIDIDSKGVVTAYYSNNQSSEIGQIAVANFSNLQGLRQVGDTTWALSSDSGSAVMGSAGTGQFGDIQAGALEASNTSDTTAQLVNMIKAQRNYQANAQVLTTDNTLATALFNAVR
jgi:flagellar hook protein FlgE